MVADVVLVALALGFAASIGAHYTGACMGMPHALGLVTARRALFLMAPLAFLGAALASHAVAARVGSGLVQHRLTLNDEILVPLVAVALGFALTRALDRLRELTSGRSTGWVAPLLGVGGSALVAIGLAASFAMGANDVANATGALVGARVLAATPAGVLGGIGLAVGVLLWGKPLLSRVAFEIVRVDQTMASAAQMVQAAVVLAAVGLGYFTSLNQALVGAMAGAGLARGRETVQTQVLRGILRGWAFGPGSGLALGFGFSTLLVTAFGARLIGP